MLELSIDIIWIVGFALVLAMVNQLVKLGKFDWLKIPFSRNGNKKVITADKTAWATYGVPVSIGLVIVYAVYRVIYQ